LVACCDESYSDAATYIVAGYVGRATDWRKLEFAWRTVLRRLGIKEFHAVDCAQGREAFEGWAPLRRETLQRELADLLRRSGLRPVVTAIQLPGWPAIAHRLRVARPKHAKPYHLAFEHQITLMAQ